LRQRNSVKARVRDAKIVKLFDQLLGKGKAEVFVKLDAIGCRRILIVEFPLRAVNMLETSSKGTGRPPTLGHKFA